jgi:hypothetical protein
MVIPGGWSKPRRAKEVLLAYYTKRSCAADRQRMNPQADSKNALNCVY